ncbi:hypothetical protein BKA58DRAFT_381504 [Alternaria rosae]|uniref:uncharacterized protein n=1 Tax=Alternaria rosae TaxID=1187941 RepID=UPI001E8E3C1F|nr:uncharacterized protein BKA58DRAFT_381504 [Alternaria rosae]KAH6872177.1 hypothetical protein BKA58DRAFT_381504 [Alternaria rosae]
MVKDAQIDTKFAKESMTWQQEKDFGNLSLNKPQSGHHHWVPFAAEENAPVQPDDPDSWLARQSEFSNPPKQSRQNGRGKAAAHHASAVEPPKPTLPTPPRIIDPDKNQKPPNKRSSRNNNKKAGNNMAGPTNGRASVYVPPHLRNCNSADGGKADSAHDGSVAINGSPATSDQSKLAMNSKSDLISNGANHQQDSSSSSPTTSRGNGKYGQRRSAMPEPVAYNGWDEPKAEPPPTTKAPGNPRWPRGPQPYKKTVWPKTKDMKYIPSSSDSDGGVSFKSNSNGDPEYDIKKLTDWNGDWLPVPETWNGRKGHADRHFGAHIAQWVDAIPGEAKVQVYLPPNTFTFGKEVAPRYWLEIKIEGDNLRENWQKLVTTKSEPKLVDENDLIDYLPWWELYEDTIYEETMDAGDGQDQKRLTHASSYLHPLTAPDARVDLDDEKCPTAPHVLASTEAKVQAINKRIADKYRKTMAKRSRPMPESKLLVQQMVDRRLRPEANIYIRPIQVSDVLGITEIYNFYVRDTIFTAEFDERTVAQIAARISDITSAGLPFLVAVSKSNQHRIDPGYVNEKIVGFINLDEHCGQATQFRYTFELELFVHPGFVSKGIGKCLVDRLLEMADTSYRARGGYEYVNNFEYLKTGPSRVVKTILLNVHHENGEDLDAGWRGKFLSACKFVRVGRLPKVGHKHDKVIDVSIFAHHTKEDIDPSARPTVAG